MRLERSLSAIEPLCGDINRGRWLALSRKAVHQGEIGEVRFDGRVDFVAIEGDDDRCVGGGRDERGAIDFEIAFIDGLAQWDACGGNNLRVEGCVHEHGRARIDCEQRRQHHVYGAGTDGDAHNHTGGRNLRFTDQRDDHPGGSRDADLLHDEWHDAHD